ncbi:hypothetical protein AAE478_009550 [Parahypoxylon ruwenzoriense]
MADIQILNGLAILIAGFVFLPEGLSALHWKMIVYLAWFSSATNLSALIFLRSYLVRHPFEIAWRLGSTFIVLVITTVALVPTGHFFWRTSSLLASVWEDAAPSDYAICYFHTKFKASSFVGKNSMLLSILLLVFSYTTRMFKLYRGFGYPNVKYPSASAFLMGKCLKSASLLQSLIGRTTFMENIASNMIIAAHFVVCLWIDIYTSVASDTYWLVVSLVWGTLRLTELREILESPPIRQDGSHEDDRWGFGQILPVLLMAGPILTLIRYGRKAFAPVSPEAGRPSLAEPDSGTLHEQEGKGPMASISIMQEQDQQPQNTTTATLIETNTPCSNETSSCWVLNPDLFTRYYEKSSWMFWAPSICLAYIIYMTTILLFPPAAFPDPINQISSLTLWLVLEQGAAIQFYILICSYLNAKWEHPTVHIAMFCCAAAAIYLSIENVSMLRPLLFVCGTFALFLLVLVVALASRVIRKAIQSYPFVVLMASLIFRR